MVHTSTSERQQYKIRGNKVPKRDNGGKFKTEILDTKGPETCSEGGIVIRGCVTEKLHKPVIKKSDSIIKENLSSPEKENSDVMIETLEFKNGENVLSIRFSKKNNRHLRIQVFLNDDIEIRPVSYTGSSTGNSFWNLLKGALKK